MTPGRSFGLGHGWMRRRNGSVWCGVGLVPRGHLGLLLGSVPCLCHLRLAAASDLVSNRLGPRHVDKHGAMPRLASFVIHFFWAPIMVNELER